MKLLLDANLSDRLIRRIAGEYPDAKHVKQTGLSHAAPDLDVWTWARDNNYAIIVSYDQDFVDLLERFGAPPKVIRFRFGNQRTATIAQFLINRKADIQAFIEDEKQDLLEFVSIA